MEEVKERWICGFWRRIGALLVDGILLGIFGLVLGLFLESLFVQMGGWGRLVGFAISITYFGLMNSSAFNGQTIGKKWLKIRVVDASNNTISLPKSFLRYSFLAVPFSLNGAQITNEVLLSYLMYPLSLIIFGGLLSIAYLYVFNRKTRQSLHDLVVGTYVVNEQSESEDVPPIWKAHLAVVGSLLVLALLLPVFTSSLAQTEPFNDLLATQEAINNHYSVTFASVEAGTNTSSVLGGETTTTSYVSTTAILNENIVDDGDLARQLAVTLLKSYPGAQSTDVIVVTLSYGYDIGIASSWHNYSHQFAPGDLMNSL